ncbi:MAG: FAD-dependent oxidoreductase [Gemmatimonadota bacterium]|nr:MAG: FAD-dependent oxidoreductase [Gemmatimonadota bacterium]
MATHRTLVVGGGVIGLCCAYFLARRGVDVTVLERDEIGKGASFGNAGTISPGHPPINRPGRIREAIRQMLNPTSPLYVAPRWDPALAKWLWAFSRKCTSAHVDKCMRVMAPLGREAVDEFSRLVEHEALECEYTPGGYYEVCRTPAGAVRTRHEVELLREHGYSAVTLTGGALKEREPTLAAGTSGGAYFPEAATCHPYRFVLEVAERTSRIGGQLLTGRAVAELVDRRGTVAGVRMADGEVIEADSVVLATGAHSPQLARKLGLDLPIQPGKGYHRDLGMGDGGAPNLQVPCVLSESSVFCTPLDGFVRFAGTMEFSGLNLRMRKGRLEQLTKAAGQYIEGVGDSAPISEWCGLRPVTSDGLPIIGPVPGRDGLYLAMGHGMLGLTLGPITGRVIAEYIQDGSPSVEIAALSPERF